MSETSLLEELVLDEIGGKNKGTLIVLSQLPSEAMAWTSPRPGVGVATTTPAMPRARCAER